MADKKKDEGVPVEYFYAGLRMTTKNDLAAFFEIVDKTKATDEIDQDLVFTVPAKRLVGAQIGCAYTFHHRGGATWSFPVGYKWHLARVENVKNESMRATWEVQDRAAKQEKAAMKWRKDDAFDKAMEPLQAIYWRLSSVERVTFETMILRSLRRIAK